MKYIITPDSVATPAAAPNSIPVARTAAASASSPLNPFAAQVAVARNANSVADAEAYRRSHIATEVSIKCMGMLHLIIGVVSLVIAPIMLFGEGARQSGNRFQLESNLLVLGLSLAFAVFHLWMGTQLRNFKNVGRIIQIVLSVFALFAFPVGTIVGAFCLYVLLSSKATNVCSPEYQQVIDQAPNVRYETSYSRLFIIAALFVAILCGGAVLAVKLESKRQGGQQADRKEGYERYSPREETGPQREMTDEELESILSNATASTDAPVWQVPEIVDEEELPVRELTDQEFEQMMSEMQTVGSLSGTDQDTFQR